MLEQLQGLAGQVVTQLEAWALSPAAWVQAGLLVVCWLLAGMVSRFLRPRLAALLDHLIARVPALAVLRGVLPLIFPLAGYAIATVAEAVALQTVHDITLIGIGKRLFLLVAAWLLVRDVLRDPFLRFLGRVILLPMAALYALGLIEPARVWLDSVVVPLGNLSFSLLWLVKLLFIGGVIFTLGRWSNAQSTQFITSQQELRPATRQLAIKGAEILIYGAAFLVLTNIMGINLTSLMVIGGAIGVGVGLGLQQIASNFISGIILLLEGQATVGDFVELDGGEKGTIVRMTMRAIILETFDGRWIVVPNEHFITTRVTNYSDQGSANRLEVPFSVSYDADINEIPALIEAAVAAHPGVLSKPEAPDCELRGFGESGVEFAVEFWVNGIDDGKNRYTSDVLFIIWNTLKGAGIKIPYPHRVVEVKGAALADGADRKVVNG